MRFRLGFVTGFAVGYTLGAKAGRERYEQIVALSRKVSRSEPAQQLQAEVRDAAARAGQALEEKAAEGVSRISDKASQGVSRITDYVRGGDSEADGGSPQPDATQPGTPQPKVPPS